jgi:hypothetical protein
MAAHLKAQCPATERRDEVRYSSSARVKIFAGGEAADEGRAVDVSSGGVCISLSRPLRTGALYRVIVIDDHSDGPEEQTRVGRVCFCIARDDAYRIGLQLF